MSVTGKSHLTKLLTFALVLFLFMSNFAGMVPFVEVASAEPVTTWVSAYHGYYDSDGGPITYKVDHSGSASKEVMANVPVTLTDLCKLSFEDNTYSIAKIVIQADRRDNFGTTTTYEVFRDFESPNTFTFEDINSLYNQGITLQYTINFLYTADNLILSPIDVTYHPNGATGGVATVDPKAPYFREEPIGSMANTFERTGYVFLGWNTKADGTGFSVRPHTSITVGDLRTDYTNDAGTGIDLYAQWSNVNVAHHYIYYMGGSYNQFFDQWKNESKLVTTNVPITLNDWYKYDPAHYSTTHSPVKIIINESISNVTFEVFSNDVKSTLQSFTFEDDIGYNVSIYYVNDASGIGPYYINYHSNGATGGDVPADSIPYSVLEPAVALNNVGSGGDGTNILEKVGDTFAGWNTKADGTGLFVFPGQSFIVDKYINDAGTGIDLYAQWKSDVENDILLTHYYLQNGVIHENFQIFYEYKPVTRGVNYNLLDWAYYQDRSTSLDGEFYPTEVWTTRVLEQEHSSSFPNVYKVWNASYISAPRMFTFKDNADYNVTFFYRQYNMTYPIGPGYRSNGATSGTTPSDPIGGYVSNMSMIILGNIGRIGDGTDTMQRPGYAFTGWNSKADGTGVFYTPYSDVPFDEINPNLYAQWEPVPYNVTFNAMGGTFGPTAEIVATPLSSLVYDRSQTDQLVVSDISYDSLITEPSPAATNGTANLEGWYTTFDYQSGTEWNFVTDTITEDVTLYAKWVAPPQYTVTYHDDGFTGGSVPVDGSSPYDSGSIVAVLPEGSLVKTNHAFSGWNLTGGDAIDYVATDTFTITDNVDLYPVWTEDGKYVVIYRVGNSDGGTPPVDFSSPYFAGDTVDVLDNIDLVKANHTFAGWNNTSANGLIADYVFGDDFSMPSSNVNLYPIWNENPKYTVTYHDDGSTGGTEPTDGLSPYYSGSTVTVLSEGSLVNSTHTFTGWNKNGAGNTTVDYFVSDTFIITDNIDLYPVWIENGKYVVTYHLGSGDSGTPPVDSSSPYFPNDIVYVLDNSDLVKANHSFIGWNETDSNGAAADYVFNDDFLMPATNVNLYPVWAPSPTYTVTYYLYDNSPVTYTDGFAYHENDTITVENLSDVNATAHTYQGQWTRSGYTFTGWKYIPATITVNSGQFDMPADNAQIVGTWKRNGGPGPGPNPDPDPEPKPDPNPSSYGIPSEKVNEEEAEIAESPLAEQKTSLVFPLFASILLLAAAIVAFRYLHRRKA